MNRRWLAVLWALTVACLGGAGAGESATRPAGRIEVGSVRQATVEVTDGDPAVLRITCPSGIGGVELVLASGTWPSRVKVWLEYGEGRPFGNLEMFEAKAAGRATTRPAVLEHRRGDDGSVEVAIPADWGHARIRLDWIDAYRR